MKKSLKTQLKHMSDIASKNVLNELKNQEDREFLEKQRQNVFSCSMGGIDLQTAGKECRKRQRKEKEALVRARYEKRQTKAINSALSEFSSAPSTESEL